MIKKKTMSILLVAAILTVFGMSSAQAAKSFCNAGKVTQAGVYPAAASDASSKYMVSVSCTLADGDWDGDVPFYLTPDVGDAGYATALTAISTGQSVKVRVAKPNPASLMDLIYLNAQ